MPSTKLWSTNAKYEPLVRLLTMMETATRGQKYERQKNTWAAPSRAAGENQHSYIPTFLFNPSTASNLQFLALVKRLVTQCDHLEGLERIVSRKTKRRLDALAFIRREPSIQRC